MTTISHFIHKSKELEIRYNENTNYTIKQPYEVSVSGNSYQWNTINLTNVQLHLLYEQLGYIVNNEEPPRQ